ncbi:MAG: hypothetical protein ACKVVP_20470, partial [Chloroflexota bacterium]
MFLPGGGLGTAPDYQEELTSRWVFIEETRSPRENNEGILRLRASTVNIRPMESEHIPLSVNFDIIA